ncbi:4-hydroxy-4-methyl-2-oxoglutarate aldolase [Thermocatellispora tengchongensis]|uniref:Putative 4-hydroxy-4-methyl-2-oxoglutarate aldolase n=1 Tax=Thermocatellispora tengchongensis TaxID=1073253 RepID=A0A840NZ74_9ACTN|nr:RraA family protein [Thermocatellispora tengchongensis]MBB5130961.1 4-hydroxy-4-methyl-2-oxoglutarate aldolase [Thermocatellispora tengchongensis]
MVPPTTAIADVLQLRGQNGWLSPPLRPVYRSQAILGAARTIRLAKGPGPEGLKPLHRLLDEDLEGRIIVIAGAQVAAGAVWGEILTRAALASGAFGVLVEGGVRDADSFRDLELPVWALYEATAGPGFDVHVASIGEPVEISGVTVTDGDSIVMDWNGVVVLPSDDDVLGDACAYADAEENVVIALRDGSTLAEAYRYKADMVAKIRTIP